MLSAPGPSAHEDVLASRGLGWWPEKASLVVLEPRRGESYLPGQLVQSLVAGLTRAEVGCWQDLARLRIAFDVVGKRVPSTRSYR